MTLNSVPQNNENVGIMMDVDKDNGFHFNMLLKVRISKFEEIMNKSSEHIDGKDFSHFLNY